MQTLDTLLLLALAVCALALLVRQRRVAVGAISLASLLLVLHVAIEGARWQMVPALGAYVMLGFVLLRDDSKPRGQRFPGAPAGAAGARWWTATAALLLALLTVGLSQALPMFALPPPDGVFAVGVVQRSWQDSARIDPHSSVGALREIPVRIWYPAARNAQHARKRKSQEARSEPAFYWDHRADRNERLVAALNLPVALSFVFSHIANIRTHAWIDAPVASGRHPVLIYSHGLNLGFSGQNTMLMEHLASHGFVVVALEHTYWGLPVTLSDGTVADGSGVFGQFQEGWRNRSEAAEAVAQHFAEDQPPEKFYEYMQELMRLQPDITALERAGVALWSADQSFAIDQLDRLQNSDPVLAGALDAERLGIIGMSFGGTTVVDNCAREQRCRVGVNIDGFQPPSVDVPAITKPMLYFAFEKNQLAAYTHRVATGPSYFVRIAGTEHANYSDFALLAPLTRGTPGILGQIDGRTGLAILNDYTLSFLQQELLGAKSELLRAGNPAHPAVTFDYRAPSVGTAPGR